LTTGVEGVDAYGSRRLGRRCCQHDTLGVACSSSDRWGCQVRGLVAEGVLDLAIGLAKRVCVAPVMA